MFKTYIEQFNDELSMELLIKVTTILEKNNINYWLDTGTLLGFIRDNSFIPWDEDIDISVWEDEKDLIINELAKNKDYFIFYKLDQDAIQVFTNKKGVRFLDITFYRNQQSYAIRKWRNETLFKNNMKLINKIIYTLIVSRTKKFQGLNTYNNSNTKITKVLLVLYNQIILNLLRLLPNNIVSFIVQRLYSLLQNDSNYITSKVPKSYFDNLETIRLNGYKCKIPSNAESYLKHRYGVNWEIPNKNYNYLNDDRSIR